MRSTIKALTGWDRRSESSKAAIHHRSAVAFYKARLVMADVARFLPFPLPAILRLAGTDKHQPDGHLYGDVYERYFRPLRWRRIRMLEIGVGGYGFGLGGQSLIAWRAFFPRGRIVAMDLYPRPDLSSGRTKVYQADQSSRADLLRIAEAEGPFHIIIDDGSHRSDHQITTFHALFDHVRDGGVYVIEDVMTSHWSFGGWDGAQIGTSAFEETCVGWFTRLARYVNHDEFESAEGVDSEMVRFAQSIGHVLFEKNLIILTRHERNKGETAIHRLKARVEATEAAAKASQA